MKRKRNNKLSAIDTADGARAKAGKGRVCFRVAVLLSSIVTDD